MNESTRTGISRRPAGLTDVTIRASVSHQALPLVVRQSVAAQAFSREHHTSVTIGRPAHPGDAFA